MVDVGGAFLSAFLQVLFDRLSPEAEGVINFFKGKKSNIVNLLEELNAVLLSADALLDDAEDKLIRDHKVRTWHEMLQEVIYVADELLDKIDYEALRCKMEGDSGSSRSKFFTKLKISTSFSSFDSAVEPEIKDILHRLKVLIDQKDALGLKQGVQHMKSSQRPPAPLVEESNVYGRNDDKEAIVKLLLSDDTGDTNKISVIPIVGMGGVGKTTLAQLIYNDDRVQRHFDPLRVWVTVSDDFDVYKITKRIYEGVTTQTYNFDDLFELQNRLKEALKGKKFLFVLDDVWNENNSKWVALKSSFESGMHGSKILVTTRNTTIASKMTTGQNFKLGGISETDCWQLFTNHAFINNVEAEAYPDLQDTGRDIVKKCKGLPLALKSLGGLLRSERNPTIWKNIMQSDMWQLYEKEDDILPALWLSYRHLPSHLKRCFAYLSMFPKDYLFRKEKIILLWMGEGFLTPDRKQNFKMEEVGEEYFQELLSRSFLQQSNQDKRAFQIHDLLHDLAIFVSGPFSYSHGNDSRKLTCKTRHLMYDGEFEDSLSKVRNLHTFWSWVSDFTRSDALLKLGGYLRVLCLHSCQLEYLPDFLGSLKCLRYLDLSFSSIKEIPNSICSLYKLQTLLLSYCYHLTHLPTNIGNLINLRHLDIRGVPLKEMPLQICDMKKLQSLTQIVLGAEHSGTISSKEITKLQHLCGETLRISGLDNVIDARDLLEANFKDKNCLRALRLEWSNGDADDSHKEIEILDALQPHTNLENLTIESYRGTRFSDWVGNPSFSNIISMSLENCKNCCFLPPLGHLPFLNELYISGFDGVGKIDDGFCGNIGPSFRSLETLSLAYMSEWTEWSFREATKEGGAFPSLTSFFLWECPKLKLGFPAYLPSLSVLSIYHCEEMEGILPGTQLTEVVFPHLENVRIVYCPELELPLQWGSHSNLRDLHIRGCKKMWENRRHWDTLRLSSLKRIIFGLEDESFPEEGLLPTTLTSLAVRNCENLECLNSNAFQQLTSLEKLEIWNCKKLRCLPEEGLPASLNWLIISYCPLLKERCEREQGEDWPKISHIANISII